MGALFFGSGTTAPINLQVAVTNPAKGPIVVRRVRVQPSAMAEYNIIPMERMVRETIAPGETRAINISGTAVARYARLIPSEPLGVRTILDYDDAGGKHHQDLYILLNVSQ